MGAYDYVQLNHPLFGEDCGERGTTKDFACPFMEQYEISPEGTLLKTEVHYEDHSDPNAKGLMGLRGLMTPVPTGKKVDEKLHGYIDISTAKHEWHCHFKNGLLVSAEDFGGGDPQD